MLEAIDSVAVLSIKTGTNVPLRQRQPFVVVAAAGRTAWQPNPRPWWMPVHNLVVPEVVAADIPRPLHTVWPTFVVAAAAAAVVDWNTSWVAVVAANLRTAVVVVVVAHLSMIVAAVPAVVESCNRACRVDNQNHNYRPMEH